MPDKQLSKSRVSCGVFRDGHVDYVDGTLSPVHAREFDAHVASCRSCGDFDATVRRSLLLARNLPEIQPSQRFFDDLQTRLVGAEADPQRPIVGGAATAVVVAAVLALVALVPLSRIVNDAPSPVVLPEPAPVLQTRSTGAVLVRAAENGNFTPVVVQPPAVQPAPSAPRWIAYPLQQADER